MEGVTVTARKLSWDEVSARAGRNDLPAILANNWTRLRKQDRAAAIERAWVSAEWPEQYLALENGPYGGPIEGWWLWMKMFRQVVTEEETYIHDDELKPLTELPEWIDLYRGAIEDRSTGMSWTGDRDRALWFAGRFSGLDLRRTGQHENGHLYFIHAHRELVLARFTGRGEDEYVLDLGMVDPSAVEDLGEVNSNRELIPGTAD